MKSLNKIVFLIVFGFSLISTPALSSSANNALSACLADNTTGKDRKTLAKWVFFAMSAHPEIQRFSYVTGRDRREMDELMATMVTRLITEDCAASARMEMNSGGVDGLGDAFKHLGALAMREIMNNPSVNSTFSGYLEFIDMSKFEALFSRR
ncbi:hypothetical protein [Pseudazoarcus pumilus]|uniref:hypothetical protein n=1 Tax=Pseudazoarcus pumilus TaxID=2067960 RepID=UPI000F509C20|nr:hypothetical protein [Pseudazoarcus pumilus]